MRNVLDSRYIQTPPSDGRRMSTRSEEIAFMYSNISNMNTMSN